MKDATQAEVWTHWTEHIDHNGDWVKSDKSCPYCRANLGRILA